MVATYFLVSEITSMLNGENDAINTLRIPNDFNPPHDIYDFTKDYMGDDKDNRIDFDQ